MIDRFNFYDLYGYLLPGAVLIALCWLPFGFLSGTWPRADLGATLILLATSYALGHLLQILGRIMKPGASPSDNLLIETDTAFSAELKRRIKERLRQQFDQEYSGNEAFRLCREYLIGKKVASYSEQHQGMYALMRGLGATLRVCASSYIGAALGFLVSPVLSPGAASSWHSAFAILVPCTVMLVCAIYRNPRRPRVMQFIGDDAWALSVYCVVLVISFAITVHLADSGANRFGVHLFGAAGISLALAEVCFRRYREFETLFARSVYYSFAALPDDQPPSSSRQSTS